MNRLFKVTLHYGGGSIIDYHIIAKDDLEARNKAIDMYAKIWKPIPETMRPEIDFCEFEFIALVDK